MPKKAGPNGTRWFQLDLDKSNYGGSVGTLLLERQQGSYLFKPADPDLTVTSLAVWELVGPDGGWLEDVQERTAERFGVSPAAGLPGAQKSGGGKARGV